jgi:hypothetical protein
MGKAGQCRVMTRGWLSVSKGGRESRSYDRSDTESGYSWKEPVCRVGAQGQPPLVHAVIHLYPWKPDADIHNLRETSAYSFAPEQHNQPVANGIRDIGAIFVAYSPRIIAHVLENFPMGEKGKSYHYPDTIYAGVGS